MTLANAFTFSPDTSIVWGFYLLYYTLPFILHVILASATFSDARLQQERGGGLFLVGPAVWFIAVLFTGLFAVALYWLVHHSRLRSLRPPANRRF